jgi:hypothetical protein
MTFPADYDTLTRVTADDYLDTAGKEGDVLLGQIQDAIEATQAAIGKTGETAPGTVEARLAAIPAAIAGAVTAHEVAADPHGQYTTAAEVASLAPAETAATGGALIAGGTAKATPADADLLGLSDSAAGGTLKKLSWANIKAALSALFVGALLGDSEKRLIINASDSAEATVNTTVLITAASATWASEIGSTGKPAGASGTNSDPAAAPNALKGLPWAADSGYPSGEADVASIFGGYDHVCNQLAGTIIGGGHNYIPYHAVGHGTIIGGSNNRNYGGRGTIAGGSNNTIGGVASGTVGGTDHTIIASYGGALGGYNNAVADVTAEFSGFLAGRDHSISAIGAACLGGRGNTIALGHDYAGIFGQDGISECAHAVVQAKGKFVKVGDCQSVRITYGKRSTDATLSNMAVYGSSGLWNLSAEKVAIALTARLVGMDEATGNVAIYTFDGGVKWDGVSSATVFSAGGSGATRDFVAIVDQIGVAALPHMSASSGSVRPKITGKASTTIKWVCNLSAAVTRV